MRLDHLLSREPVFGDAHQGHVSVCLVCVSCARISSLPFVWVVGVGAWVFFSGKQGCKLRGSKHAVGFTFNTV